MSSKTELVIRRGDALLGSIVLQNARYVVGRVGADIVVEDEQIAPRHAQISVDESGILLTDLESTTGTFIDGQRVLGAVRLRPEQIAHLGANVQLYTCRLNHASIDPDETLLPREAAIRRLLPGFFSEALRYRRGSVVKEGGMGIILEAEETLTGRRVAMKVMKRPDDAGGGLRRFVEEARITARLEHPNIVPVHELGLDDQDEVFYTMKFIEGDTLQVILDQLAHGEPEMLRRHPLPELLTVFQKLCDGIAFAHSRKVIHRDLKPANIMLGPYGEVLVMDWGLARNIASSSSGFTNSAEAHSTPPNAEGAIQQNGGTMEGTLAGTPHFMSPEQAAGKVASLDERSDIYALGAILRAILTLEPPVRGKTTEEVLEAVKQGRLTPFKGLDGAHPRVLPHTPGGRIPDALAAVASRAMAVRPEDRYQSVAELQREIAAYQAGFATHAEGASLVKQIRLALRRHSREARIVLTSASALFAVVVFAFVSIERARSRATADRDHANGLLEDLRRAAPVFAAQGRTLASQGNVNEALAKLDNAITILPGEVGYLLTKADLLESRLRLREALETYTSILAIAPDHARARLHAKLCTNLLENRGNDVLFKLSLGRVLAAMSDERRPETELLPVLIGYGVDPTVARAIRLGDGDSLSLDLAGATFADLEMLRGLPLSALNLSGCRQLSSIEFLRDLPLESLNLDGTGVSDLSPVASLRSLQRLSIAGTRVKDLTPLRGLPLAELDLSDIPATELSPLAGMPLQRLHLQNSSATNLSALRGMQLKILSLHGCQRLRGYETLSQLPDLEILCLPQKLHKLPIEDLKALRALETSDTIRRISTNSLGRGELHRVEGKDVFWGRWSRDLQWIQRLREINVDFTLERAADDTWELEIRDQPIRDLSVLKGAAISRLRLFNTPVEDLSPLQGMPLRVLDLRKSRGANISGIQGLPLRELYLWENQSLDFGALASFQHLEVLDASETHLENLHDVPTRNLRLLRIGSTDVRDLSPLAGSRLQIIHFDNVEVADVSPLASCEDLRWAVLTRKARNAETLRRLPRLERISYSWHSESEPMQLAAEFWTEYDQPWARALRGLGITFSSKQLADASWSIWIHDNAFRDASIFAGANITALHLQETAIDDLAPLAMLPLSILNLSKTRVSNIAPLRGLRLRELYLDYTLVNDLSVLKAMPLQKLSAEHCTSLQPEGPQSYNDQTRRQ